MAFCSCNTLIADTLPVTGLYIQAALSASLFIELLFHRMKD